MKQVHTVRVEKDKLRIHINREWKSTFLAIPGNFLVLSHIPNREHLRITLYECIELTYMYFYIVRHE